MARLMRATRRNQGFTLLEVLIAISIFAIIGLASKRVLDEVISAQSITREHDQALSQLQRGMALLERDIQQMLQRPVRAEYGGTLSAVVAPSEEYALEFSRSGWHNPLQHKRSTMQRVAYRVGTPPDDSLYETDKPYLIRHYWQVLDRAQDSEPRQQPLISGVSELQVRLQSASGDWHTRWPPLRIVAAPEDSDRPARELPVAVEVKFTSEQYGVIRRVFALNRLGQE